MKPKIAAILIALAVLAGGGVGYAVLRMSGGQQAGAPGPGATPTSSGELTSSPQPTAPEVSTVAPTEGSLTSSPGVTVQPQEEGARTGDGSLESVPSPELAARNRAERAGPAWSPADIRGPDGKPLVLGYAEPGAFGVVTIGMTTDQAHATGFIEPDAERGDVCDSPAGWWKWRGELSEGLDVYTDDRGRIVTMADRKGGIETREGIAVGNSLGAVNDTYGAVVSPAQEAGYNQSGVFIERDGKWLGFLFDASYSEVNESSRVTMIEVTEGHRPELMRDGC